MASVSMPDVHGNASLWLPGGLDIDDPEAELDGIPKVGTYVDPKATLEGEHCGFETLFHIFFKLSIFFGDIFWFWSKFIQIKFFHLS